jgi:uncharacterized membrane protein
VSTNRLEAFSDGVIAVAVTLLVIDIHVPASTPGHTLAHQLLHQWPSYAAYATSFISIGIVWINHHAMISRLREADHMILVLNLLLLMSIGLLPFVTALMASYLRHPHGEQLAAGVYAGGFLVMSVAFLALNRHILLGKAHLLEPQLPEERRRRILKRSASGFVPYVLALALAPVNAYATIAICGAIAIFYSLPLASGYEAGDPAGLS